MDVCGHLSSTDSQALNNDAYALVRHYGAHGVLVVLDRSDVAVAADITIQQLDTLASLDRSMFRPGAFVVAQRDLGLFRELSWRMSKLGIVAAAFTDRSNAANFAVKKGAVWRAEIAFRQRQAATAPQRC